MTEKLHEIKTWPVLVVKNLQAFEPIIVQEEGFGPIVHTAYCWIYKHHGQIIVHNKEDDTKFRSFPNWKGAVLDVVIRFGGFNRTDKK